MGNIRLGRIAGIAVHLDWSLLIIFLLIAFSLASAVFPHWHPDWSVALRWGTALGAALLFLVSVLIHELSHALVGRARGIEINRITLFIFGGMAQMEEEPRAWRAEFWMAIVGPLTSLVLGFLFLSLASIFMGPMELDPDDPQAFLGELSPLASLLLWLGNVNIILAIFNLVPGFPLDGGRVLRAALWGATGDLRRATRWASLMGRGFAWLLIACGFAMLFGIRVPIFGTGFGGLWLMLIGWFLYSAALMSYRQLLVRESLQDVPVARMMQRDLDAVAVDTGVRALVDEHLMRGDQRAYPVYSGEKLVGLVTLDDVRRLEREAWDTTRVDQAMTPREKLIVVAPDDDAADALFALSNHNVNQLPVVDQGVMVGMVRREDIMKWLTLSGGDTGDDLANLQGNGPGR